jgi:hypothetical protein
MHKKGVTVRDWTAFGTAMLALVGALNVSEGTLVGFSRNGIGFDRAAVAFTSANTWAAATVTLGLLLVIAGLTLYAAQPIARLVAVSVVAMHAVTQIAILHAYPAWSVLMVALDVIILFVLTVPRYPARSAAPARVRRAVRAASTADPVARKTLLRRNVRQEAYRARHKAGQPPAEPLTTVTELAWVRAIGQASVPVIVLEPSGEHPIVVAEVIETEDFIPELATDFPAEADLVPAGTEFSEMPESAGELAAAGVRPYVI